jgi:hypothetical protein
MDRLDAAISYDGDPQDSALRLARVRRCFTMNVEEQPASPEQLRLGAAGRDVRFVLRKDLVALHGPRAAGEATRSVFSLPGAGIEVVAASDVAARDARRRGPVYAQEPTGNLAVPTGRVFLRFGAGGRPTDWVARLQHHGFAPVENQRDAPGTAWVAPIDGRIEAGLARLGQLAALTGIEAAEPELVRESRRR